MSESESKLKDYFGERIPYQMILFGPPGTGKSYSLKEFCKDITKKSKDSMDSEETNVSAETKVLSTTLCKFDKMATMYAPSLLEL